ncbi:MAG: efflux RND transporter periplasmic adaptor subunit [Gammaproteobacteria bacterium]|nr:efflux RND transporter periplasmic adaptor subunit [Gammaproteobacteria bacterium]
MSCRLKFVLAILGLLAASRLAAAPLETLVTERVVQPLEYRVDGVVEARRQATLSAQVAGEVEAVYFDVDDFVEQGSLVMKIRDRDYRARAEQARAARAEAEAALREARLEFSRSEDLRKQKLISQAQFDRAEAGLAAAVARAASATAAVAGAEELLGYTVLRAPYSGVVVERHVEPGESVQPGQPIITGYAEGELRVSADVPQSQIDALRRLREVRVIRVETGASLAVDKITIHPFANPANHSFRVRLDLPSQVPGLYPGMLVKVALAVGQTERLLLPSVALVSRSEVNAVYVADAEGRLSLRQVRPGNRYGEQIEILAGLEAGERVALDPVKAGIEHKRQLAGE